MATKLNINGINEIDLTLPGTTVASVAAGVLTVTNTGPGTGPELETNGTPNSTQTLLDLVAGSNITLVESAGSVTITATGGTVPSVQTDVTSLRTINALYQNTGSGPRIVQGYIVTTNGGHTGNYAITNGPTSSMGNTPFAQEVTATVDGGNGAFWQWVPAGWYYELNAVGSAGITVGKWYETN